MMHEKDTKFREYVSKFGSRFIAVRYVAAKARELAEENDNTISHSEALTWFLTGERPDTLDLKDKIARKRQYKISFTDDLLSGVDDQEVCDAVRESIRLSNLLKNLVYSYKDVSDECRMSRIRILVRMIWYQSHPYTENQEEYLNEEN